MDQQHWRKVDDYLVDELVVQDEALLATLAANKAAGLPAIDVAPNQGKLLHIFAKMIGAKRILEIGTLGGYSTIWLARALPEDGKVITLEFDPRHAEIASHNLRHAGLEQRVTILVGAALETLPSLSQSGPFDLIFIDADKRNNPDYFNWALKLARPGTVIIGDNVVRNGQITDADSQDANIQGLRQFIAMQASDPNLTATAIQTVGGKGWDGFSIAIVNQ